MKIDYIKVWQDQSALQGRPSTAPRGADFFSGTDGNDVIQGVWTAPNHYGGPRRRPYLGGNGNDRLPGGQGKRHMIDGGVGADAMVGGAAATSSSWTTTGDTILELAGYGFRTVKTLGPHPTGLAGPLEAMMYTGSGNFSGTGNSLDNRMESGGGNDTLLGGAATTQPARWRRADKLNSGIGDRTHCRRCWQ